MALRRAHLRTISMALERKVRARGDSLMVAIPGDIAKMMGLTAGDSFAFDVLGREQLVLKLVKRPIPASGG